MCILGTFARVSLARLKDQPDKNKVYALKILRKADGMYGHCRKAVFRRVRVSADKGIFPPNSDQAEAGRTCAQRTKDSCCCGWSPFHHNSCRFVLGRTMSLYVSTFVSDLPSSLTGLSALSTCSDRLTISSWTFVQEARYSVISGVLEDSMRKLPSSMRLKLP